MVAILKGVTFLLLIKILGLIFAVILAYAVFLIICSLFVNTSKEYDEHSRFYRALLNGFTAVGLWVLRVKVHTTGIEKIPKGTKNLLFVSNHRSNYDPIVTWHVLKKWQPAFVSKADNFKIPIFGRFIRKCCFMAIDRENPREAMKTINKAADLLKRGEVSVGVYPEGTRSKGGQLLPFHNGVFKIAQKAGADIVVLAVAGTENIYRNLPFGRTDVCLDVIDVIPADAVKGCKTAVIGERVYDGLQSHLSAEDKEVMVRNARGV